MIELKPLLWIEKALKKAELNIIDSTQINL